MTQSTTAELDQVISILQSDLTTIPVDTALQIIDNLEQQVASSSNAGGIASGLAQLKQFLHMETVAPAQFGQVLAELGSQTRVVASEADPVVAEKLGQISELLIQAGQPLI